MIRRVLAVLLAVAICGTGQAEPESDLDAAFDRSVLIIAASQHACHRFDVYLALRRAQQVRGLMHVRNLPRTTGMLFVYQDDEYHSMWMKNTYIPLDILFIRRDGSIANIARHTEPLSLRSIVATEPVAYVLELNAGVTEGLAIDADSRVLIDAMAAGSD